jgi:hypothetical protein
VNQLLTTTASMQENYRVLQKQLEELQKKIGSGGTKKKKRTEGGKKR